MNATIHRNWYRPYRPWDANAEAGYIMPPTPPMSGEEAGLPKHSERTCMNPECAMFFEPNSPNQMYCSRSCRKSEDKRRQKAESEEAD